jgi:hypothetical protein
MLLLCLVLGTLDLMMAAAHRPLLPRQLYDNTYVGARFHGIAGEPRDAFVYLFFALAILHLESFYRGVTLDRRWIAVIVVAALLTQSGSGLVGLALFVGLYIVYTLPRMGLKRLIQILILTTVVAVTVYEAIVRSPRLMLYARAATGVWSALQAGAAVPGIIAVQVSSFFPLYELWRKLVTFNWIPVFIGSGLGSASAVNSHYIGASGDLANPTSQLVRTLYESGIIGTILFLRAFTKPVTYLTRHLPPKRRNGFLVMMLLLVGCFLAHRSSAAFIYVGIVIAVFRVLDQRPPALSTQDAHLPSPSPELTPVGAAG